MTDKVIRNGQRPGSAGLSLPGAHSDVCHSQILTVFGNLWVNHISENLDPKTVQQVHSGQWSDLAAYADQKTNRICCYIPVDVQEISGEDIIVLGCRRGSIGFRRHCELKSQILTSQNDTEFYRKCYLM